MAFKYVRKITFGGVQSEHALTLSQNGNRANIYFVIEHERNDMCDMEGEGRSVQNVGLSNYSIIMISPRTNQPLTPSLCFQ